MLNVWHPMEYLPSDVKIYLSKDGVTERWGPGWADERSTLWKVIDLFDIAGIFKTRDEEKFWDREEENAVVAG